MMSDRPDHRHWNAIAVEFECPETVTRRNLFGKTHMVEMSRNRLGAQSRISTTVRSRIKFGRLTANCSAKLSEANVLNT